MISEQQWSLSFKSTAVGLACNGSGILSLIPLHSLTKNRNPFICEDEEYHNSCPGYLTSKNGPKMPDSVLGQVHFRIVVQTGLRKPLKNDFDGDTSDTNLFARIIRGELSQWRIWEDDAHVACLTPFGNTPGYAGLIPRVHLGSNVFGLAMQDDIDLVKAAHAVAQHLENTFGVKRCGMFLECYEIDYAHLILVSAHEHSRPEGFSLNVLARAARVNEKYQEYLWTLGFNAARSLGVFLIDKLLPSSSSRSFTILMQSSYGESTAYLRSTSSSIEQDTSREIAAVTGVNFGLEGPSHDPGVRSIGLAAFANDAESQGAEGLVTGEHAKRVDDEGSDIEDDDESIRLIGTKKKTLGIHEPSPSSRPRGPGRQISFGDENEQHEPHEESLVEKEKLVTWSSLPNKGQLAVLTMARLSEPLTQTSLQAYMFYQLKSFDPSLSDSTIASQAGIMQGSFTAAQFMTAIMWGRIADANWGGRKRVLLIGLLGTCISCVGFGFSRSFSQAMIFRSLGGALNGNVGVMRTLISEIIKEKKYQSRAFLLLPICFNIGVIIGPILGGLLADPVRSYPGVFGDNSILGGKHGVAWMRKWPYALPNLMSALFLFISASGVVLGLEETLDSLRDRPDIGLRIGRSLASLISRLLSSRSQAYTALPGDDILDTPLHIMHPLTSPHDVEDIPRQPATKVPSISKPKRKLPLRRIWTRNVLFTLLAHGILAFHVGTFNNLWFTFLSTARFDPSSSSSTPYTRRLPFLFTGGLSMAPRSVGFAMAILGLIGISLQLLIYPRVSHALGTVRSYRLFILCFPLAYFLTPYLAVVPTASPAPHQADGVLLWVALGVVLFVQVLARTFALPSTVILLNNCSPHPSVLGTIHGIGQSVSSASRTLGPVLGGWLYGLGLRKGVVGGVYWGLSGVAVLGWVVSGWLHEGDGHEIFLEGEGREGGGERGEGGGGGGG
ncbi:MAG: hypothetical protein M1827_001953 [Pycnora praestabilis]|nr:MAG: hypothetical protein M1827_001953 [Pycnora praestabilis]